MKWAIVSFPGSNCEEDTRYVLSEIFGQEAHIIWHQERSLAGADAVVLPGGFAHGDYLRCGAIARFSPIMEAVLDHAARGGLVLGICNGMQVLTEAGLLPGALLRNESLEYRCSWVWLRAEGPDPRFLRGVRPGQVLHMPISHGEGRYYCDDADLEALAARGQILLRYSDAQGTVSAESSPNGAMGQVAGLRNAAGNVFGLMPHPERACESVLGGTDGRLLFSSMIEAMRG